MDYVFRQMRGQDVDDALIAEVKEANPDIVVYVIQDVALRLRKLRMQLLLEQLSRKMENLKIV